MARLVTGEFNTRSAAEAAIEDLVKAGIPREQIYIETEIAPPADSKDRVVKEVQAAERERRIAGLETGTLIGAIMGVMAGLALAAFSFALHEATRGQPNPAIMSWPFNSWLWSAVVGLIGGALIGALMGATVDVTLTKLGAGPAAPREECLVTVRVDDAQMEKASPVFFHHRARHVCAAEIAG